MIKSNACVKISNRKDITFELMEETLRSTNNAESIGFGTPTLSDPGILKSENVTKICYGLCGDDYLVFALERIDLPENNVISKLYSYDKVYKMWLEICGVNSEINNGILDILMYNGVLICIREDGIHDMYANYGSYLPTHIFGSDIFSFDSEKYVDATCIDNKLYVLTDKRIIIISRSIINQNPYNIQTVNFAPSLIPPSGIVRNITGKDVIMYANNNGIIPFFYKLIDNDVSAFVDESPYNVINAVIFNNRLLVYGDDSLIHIIPEIDSKENPIAMDFTVYKGHHWIGNVKYFEGKLWNQYITNVNGERPILVFANSLNGTDFDSYLVRDLAFDVSKHNAQTIPICIESTPYGLLYSNQKISIADRGYNLFNLYHNESGDIYPIVDMIHDTDNSQMWRIVVKMTESNISDINDIIINITNMSNDIGFAPIIHDTFIAYDNNDKYLVIDIRDPLTEEKSEEIRGKKYIDINDKDDIVLEIRYRNII